MNSWDYLKNNTFNYLVEQALKRIPNDIDKRQGSVVYDMIAPCMAAMAQAFIELQLYYSNTYLLTAAGESLDDIAGNFAIERYQASYAERLATFKFKDGTPYNIEIGARFSTETTETPIFYTVTEKIDEGRFALVCETLGTIGNEYVGFMLPVENYPQLGSVYMDTVSVPARDIETDTDFRNRVLEWLRNKPFGGNVAHYRQWALDYTGIGAVQVYPVWNGGGTVKLCIVDPSYKPVSEEFIAAVKEYFDPEEYEGHGIGQAPIDHRVTIVTPEEKTINVEATITTEDNVSAEGMKERIEASLEAYFAETRQKWDEMSTNNQYSCTIYLSRVIAAIINVDNVADANNVKLNGVANDVKIQTTSIKQEIPVLGTVTLHES